MMVARQMIRLILPPLFLRVIGCRAEESNEELYRRTVNGWRSRGSYRPWDEYTAELLARWQTADPSHRNRLGIVGGFEEGILAIEKATVARGEGQNVERDRALSKLYCAYGKTLLDLNAAECHQLALDPHTLLIGIETVSRDDEPSAFLCGENAENALRNAASLDATNALAAELLESVTGRESAHERKPKEFVAELFDSFADTFDEKLVKDLGYAVPKLVGDAAKALRPNYGAVLDAGCGTGLAGTYLKPLVSDAMIGVDASQKMLDIAAKCTTRKGCGLKESQVIDDGVKEVPLYDDLLVLDLEEMTLKNTLANVKSRDVVGFDLIVAADVLVYFGSLSNLLQTFSQISTPGAGLIFSTELATTEEAPLGWRLLPSGRFAHTKQHATEAGSGAGYELVSYREIVPRMERG
eukprot:CAMPEP_0172578470 /NCGR_PEP_ID=MMETSP1067-20121228/138753_1 /TAXON_ID=265564 ORGANISM="Thalassiosira punctigera, Strain Tpunct2005C2" /NCGR_SAMPLE_ID=MMETSP1067 /ASSEMBLY_ACC=CAM_ASM_000444 /LENGTH=410 /DNA_ID=CAMNT_0013371167 /DNA_START=199 /DNA_END=1427 /DNA_ORIENTATION=+